MTRRQHFVDTPPRHSRPCSRQHNRHARRLQRSQRRDTHRAPPNREKRAQLPTPSQSTHTAMQRAQTLAESTRKSMDTDSLMSHVSCLMSHVSWRQTDTEHTVPHSLQLTCTRQSARVFPPSHIHPGNPRHSSSASTLLPRQVFVAEPVTSVHSCRPPEWCLCL